MVEQHPKSHGGHVPVLFQEVMAALRPAPGGRYVDGTLGAARISACCSRLTTAWRSRRP